MSTTDLDKPDISDPLLDAENALSAKLITSLVWVGGGLFATWIVAIVVVF